MSRIRGISFRTERYYSLLTIFGGKNNVVPFVKRCHFPYVYCVEFLIAYFLLKWVVGIRMTSGQAFARHPDRETHDIRTRIRIATGQAIA